jgi:hypothetical protein
VTSSPACDSVHCRNCSCEFSHQSHPPRDIPGLRTPARATRLTAASKRPPLLGTSPTCCIPLRRTQSESANFASMCFRLARESIFQVHCFVQSRVVFATA